MKGRMGVGLQGRQGRTEGRSEGGFLTCLSLEVSLPLPGLVETED